MSEDNQINIIELIHKLKDLWVLLAKKWIIIITVIIMSSTIGVIYSINSKPKYTSTLSFVLEGESTSGLVSIASTFLSKNGANQGVFNSANILELLKSRRLVVKALLNPSIKDKNKTFADIYAEKSGLREKWDKNTELKNIQFPKRIEYTKLTPEQNIALDEIHSLLITEELEVEIRNPENTIIYIDLESKSKEFTRYFPELLISVVSDYYIETKIRKAKLNYEVLQIQTDSVRRELNNAISGVAIANDNTFYLNPAFNVKRVPSAHKEVNVQANTVILSELVKNLELSRMNLLNETPIIEIIDKPVSPVNMKKFGKIKGILIGGFLGGFFIIGFFSAHFFFQLLSSKSLENKD